MHSTMLESPPENFICSLCLSKNESVFFHDESNMSYKLVEDCVRSMRKACIEKNILGTM